MRKKLLINSDLKLIKNNGPLCLIDGGARGEIPDPFNKVDQEMLYSFRFEPDSKAQIVQTKNETIFNKGLWSSKNTLKLNIGKSPAASSCLEINTEIAQQFDKTISIDPRKAVRTEPIKVTSLDDIFGDGNYSRPDFIKLDIHGSEYEALVGGTQTIGAHVLGLQIEIWNFEIHKNQKTLFEIQGFLDKLGFQMVDIYPYARWKRAVEKELISKNEIVTFECLFFRKTNDKIFINSSNRKELVLKYLSIVNLFGYNNLAVYFLKKINSLSIIDNQEFEELSTFLTRNFKIRSSKLYNMKAAIRKQLSNLINYLN